MSTPEAGALMPPPPGEPARVEFATVPQERNEQFAQVAAAFIADDPRFNGQHIRVRFPQQGSTSFIAIFETAEGEMVWKLPSKVEYHKGEGMAFDAWEAEGVSVPHVFESGTYQGHAYLLMKYIDKKPLNETKTRDERLALGKYREMGEMLRKMHQSSGEGFGLVMEHGKGKFGTFAEWLDSDKMRSDIAKVVELGYLDAETIEKARTILAAYAAENPHVAFCHMDFSPQNVFDTEPLTVFDPGAELNHPIIDVGKAVICNMQEGDEAIAQLLEGYQKGSNEEIGIPPAPLDPKVLHAAVIISGLRKLTFFSKNLHRPDITARLALGLEYFARHNRDLDAGGPTA